MTTPPFAIYSSLGTDPDLASLVDAFVAEMPDRIEHLLRLYDVGQREELRRLTHQIKGAAGSYGFHALTPAAAKLEFSLTIDQTEAQIHRELDELLSLCRRIRAGGPD